MKKPPQIFQLILLLVVVVYERDCGAQTIQSWRENFFRSETAPQFGAKSRALSEVASQLSSASNIRNIRTIELGTENVSVSFSHDWTILASPQHEEGNVVLFDVEADTIITILRGHENGVNHVRFSPNAMLLASGGVDGKVMLWDVARRVTVATLDGDSREVTSMAYSKDGTILASGTVDGVVNVWDVETHTRIATLGGKTDFVSSLLFSDDGKLLASGSWDGIVSVWDVLAHEKVASLGGHPPAVLEGWFRGFFTPLSFSPDGKKLAYGTVHNLEVWDTSKRETVATFGEMEGVISAQFSPDGKLLASRTGQGIKIWEMATNRIRLFESDGDNFAPAVFSPDGTVLASTLLAFTDEFGEGEYIVLWNTENGEPIVSSSEGHHDVVWDIVFSPDGTRLASHSSDSTVKLWDVAQYLAPSIPSPDFDGDGTVGFPDFLQFAAQFGLSKGDAGFDARFDLDGNGTIGFSDFLIFAGTFGNNTRSS